MNMKFQPMPSTTNANQKCDTVTPDSAMPMATKLSNVPEMMTFIAPNRLIKSPVKKLGRNMPTTCHSKTNTPSLNGCPQKFIANGVATISRFITP